MKKKLTALFALLLLCITVPAYAAELPRFVDYAGLLSEQDGAVLNAELDEISEKLGFDVVIVTVNDLGGEDPEPAAEKFYDEIGYGFGAEHDGVLLLINMGERDWVITSTGWGQKAINKDAREYLSNAFLSDLSAGNYRAAFDTFAYGAESLVTQAQDGHFYKAPFPAVRAIVVALVVGLIIAFFVVSSMKKKLKSVAFREEAADYTNADLLHLTQSGERFLYHKVVSISREESHDSSSGGGSSHSSSSGKF